MAKYFNEQGYFQISELMKDNIPFNFVIGGRGTGKTYGALEWVLQNCDEQHKFLFMRRTENEIAMINVGNIYAEHNPTIEIKSIGKQINGVFYTYENADDVCIGYHAALSTIHNIRGFNMLDVTTIIFDEFIPERGTVVRRYAGEQFLNAYETVNRNRELQGQPPVKCLFLSNYNELESDIMAGFGFTDEIYKYHESRPLGIYKDELKRLIMINQSPISEKKKETVLYKVNKSKEFESMAIENDGSLELMPIKYYNRKAYDYCFSIGDIHVNRLRNGYYYLTGGIGDTKPTQKELSRGRLIYHAYCIGNVFANNNFVATKFCKLFNSTTKC